MEHIMKMEKYQGIDVGYHNANLHPENGEGRVGKSGIDKNYTLAQMLELAYNMKEKPNILVKAGKNAKWYIKYCDINRIEEAILSQQWRDTSRATMYIIDWL